MSGRAVAMDRSDVESSTLGADRSIEEDMAEKTAEEGLSIRGVPPILDGNGAGDGRAAEEKDAESAREEGGGLPTDEASWDWATDPANPWNWPKRRKWAQVGMIASIGFLASVGTSIVTPSHTVYMEEFGVTSTQAILPLTTYVIGIGLGPIFGGPLSEMIGRYFVFAVFTPVGALFIMGAGFSNNFVALCVLRLLAGLALAPSLAISSGLLTETFMPAERGLPVALFILTPFLGPGMGPILGAFAIRNGWRWSQWTLCFFAVFALIITYTFGRETYHPVLRRRRAKQLGHAVPARPSASQMLQQFVTVSLLRPLHMLFTEPIVALSCLYVACEFATLFTFFAAVPYTFKTVYGFSIEQSGLVFVSIIIGCLLGLATIVACDILAYRPQIPRHPPHQVPPEWRLVPAMIGSVGLPVGLFWFAWSARASVSWASPAAAIIPFAWGNLCIFISLMQYTGDTYHGTTVASAASANSFARYTLAGVFPLFTLQMYGRLGIGWASSLLGFIAVALLPVPWAFFKFGKQIRAKSQYETASY